MPTRPKIEPQPYPLWTFVPRTGETAAVIGWVREHDESESFLPVIAADGRAITLTHHEKLLGFFGTRDEAQTFGRTSL